MASGLYAAVDDEGEGRTKGKKGREGRGQDGLGLTVHNEGNGGLLQMMYGFHITVFEDVCRLYKVLEEDRQTGMEEDGTEEEKKCCSLHSLALG